MNFKRNRPYLGYGLSGVLVQLQKAENERPRNKKITDSNYIVDNKLVNFKYAISLLVKSSELLILHEDGTQLSEEQKEIFDKYVKFEKGKNS